MSSLRFTLTMILLILAVSIAHSQVPPTLSYQGMLTGTGGNVVDDGLYEFNFKLYNGADPSVALWTETQNVAVVNGIFNAILGTVNPLDLPFDEQYYLGIAVGEGPELSPRIALTASAYSFRAYSLVNNAVKTENIADGAVTLRKLNTTGASEGQLLVYNGSEIEWQDLPQEGGGLALPYNGSVDDNGAAFAIVNTGSGAVISAIANNNGTAIDAVSDGIGVYTITKGSLPALSAINTGTGNAGLFQIENTENDAHALEVSTKGTGRAGSFLHAGTQGNAGFFRNSNEENNDAALYVDGDVKINGNININGKINLEGVGNANLLSICFGSVNPDGTIKSGSGNFTVSKLHTGIYMISLPTEVLNADNYTTIVSVSKEDMVLGEPPSVAQSMITEGNLIVRTQSTNGLESDSLFSFVVYKP
jgi:hypothetical protein